MFNYNYIIELLNGKLTSVGYKHFVSVIEYYIKKFNWPRTIVLSDTQSSSKFWAPDDVKELTHQYFEWIIIKGKLKYFSKIPESYVAYYFSRMLMAFIADKIKEAQQKHGISYEKVKELVTGIANHELIKIQINEVNYYFNRVFTASDVKTESQIDSSFQYIAKIPIKETTKHYKPLVETAIDDIFNTIDSPLPLIKLVDNVYLLFDQSSFLPFAQKENEEAIIIDHNPNHDSAIKAIIADLTKEEAKYISEYVFETNGEISYSELSSKYNIPKSTLQYKIDSFKKKIVLCFHPQNEDEGLLFINKLAVSLDELSK